MRGRARVVAIVLALFAAGLAAGAILAVLVGGIVMLVGRYAGSAARARPDRVERAAQGVLASVVVGIAALFLFAGPDRGGDDPGFSPAPRSTAAAPAAPAAR